MELPSRVRTCVLSNERQGTHGGEDKPSPLLCNESARHVHSRGDPCGRPEAARRPVTMSSPNSRWSPCDIARDQFILVAAPSGGRTATSPATYLSSPMRLRRRLVHS